MVTPVFSDICAIDLFEVLWQALEQKWKKESRGFLLDSHTNLELYNKNHCLITLPPPPKPDNVAIASFFFVKSGKKSNHKFKTGTTSVYVCIMQEVYDRWQDYCDGVEYGGRDKSVAQVVSCQPFFINCTIHLIHHMMYSLLVAVFSHHPKQGG